MPWDLSNSHGQARSWYVLVYENWRKICRITWLLPGCVAVQQEEHKADSSMARSSTPPEILGTRSRTTRPMRRPDSTRSGFPIFSLFSPSPNTPRTKSQGFVARLLHRDTIDLLHRRPVVSGPRSGRWEARRRSEQKPGLCFPDRHSNRSPAWLPPPPNGDRHLVWGRETFCFRHPEHHVRRPDMNSSTHDERRNPFL